MSSPIRPPRRIPRGVLAISLSSIAVLALLPLLQVGDGKTVPPLALFLGRFHPVILHVPIGLILLALILEHAHLRGLRQWLPKVPPETATFLMFCAALSALASTVLGWMLSYGGGYDPVLLHRHFLAGLFTAIGANVALALKLVSDAYPARRLIAFAYQIVLLATGASLGLAGHLGASITHGEDYLTEYAPDPLRRLMGLPIHIDPADQPWKPLPERMVFPEVIAPVLTARCVGCHGAQKANGGLRLDDFGQLMKGGHSGAVVIAGDPAKSMLLRYVDLPETDARHMPPKGKTQLGDDERLILDWWVQAGLPEKKTVAELSLPDDVQLAMDRNVPEAVRAKRDAARREQAARLAAAVRDVQKRVPGSLRAVATGDTDLEFSPGPNPAGFGDAQLGDLARVGGDLALLDLRRTAVTDAGLRTLSKMPNLRRLQLQETNTDDAGLRGIDTLPNLEVLNLYDTRVTDKGLASLASLKKLRRLYVWRTLVTPAGEAALRKSLPKLEIVEAAPIPKPPPAPPAAVPTASPVVSPPALPVAGASNPPPAAPDHGAAPAPTAASSATPPTAPITPSTPANPVLSSPVAPTGSPAVAAPTVSPVHPAMKRQICTAAAFLFLVAGLGAALLKSSFVSFKHLGPPARDPAAVALEAALPARISFNEHVGPILSENCYYCHGQDATARQADLRVDRPEFVFAPRKNGPPPIVKGQPESSALIQRITSKDPNQVMPPPSSRKTLTPEQVALLTKWVRDGASYQEHWSFVKPERATPPAVKHPDWVKNPVDNFVLAKLEQNGLAPEPEADRRTLIRRVTLDLTGLPPAPEEVANFVNDKSPDAYERVIDRLLASPHYGEHEARYWLDAARYAETVGLHFDEPTSIYPYRDWVIKAFNDNKPFDRFTVEQVAGDLLPNPTLDQKVATGFTRCGVSTSEGGSIEAEVLASYAKEYVETNSATFLGLTLGCCACHDHKFDPISQKEFYEFSAFFRNTTQKGVGPRTAASVPPFIRVPAREDEARWNVVSKQMDDAKAAIDDYLSATGMDKKLAAPVLLQKLAACPAAPPVSTAALELQLPLLDNNGGEIKSTQGVTYHLTGKPEWTTVSLFGAAPIFDGNDYAELGNIGDFDTADAFSYGGWIRVQTGTPTGAVFARMDRNDNYRGWDLWLDHGKPAPHLISFWPRNALQQVAAKPLTPGSWQHVFVTYDGSAKAAGLKIYVDGELQSARPEEDSLTESIRSPAQFTLGRRSGGQGAEGVVLQDLRVYRRALSADEVKALCGSEVLPLVRATAPDKLNDAQRKWAVNFLLKDDPKMVALQQVVNGLKGEYDAIAERSPATMVMNDKPTPAFAYVLKRGQYDQLGEKVEPDVPKVLPPLPPGAPRNRLGLAQWMVDPANPLLSRVTVNRFWQQFFGVGIVRTAEDFGIMGERPVNQPLLDWLAVEFRESGWDVKHTLKLMVTSAAYRQSDRVTPQKLERDPENRLVSRGPRYRMDGEMIRDQALAASGLLVPRIGGPSVKPYQPDGLWEVVSMSKEVYRRDTGDALHRRSLYSYWKRLAPNPQLTTFDTPSRETCTVRRDRTDTPLQALLVENDPQYVEAARHLALNAIAAAGDPAGRLDYMSERLLARPLDDREKGILLTSLARFNDAYTKQPDAAVRLIKVGETPPADNVPAPEQAAWTMVANQFLNLDETLNK